jgi:hypothetical protein
MRSLCRSPLPIIAELAGSRTATAAGVTATGNAPVLALCRRLLEAGHDPASALEAYRGKIPCLRVRSIGEAAKLTVRENGGNGRPHFMRLDLATFGDLKQGQERVNVAPPIAPIASTLPEVPPDGIHAIREPGP